MSLQIRFIFQQLRGDSRVSKIVRDHIYPMGEVPETVGPPYITIQRISTSPFRDLAMGSGITQVRWQINCVGRSFLEAEEMLDGLRQAMDNFRGDVDVDGTTLSVRRAWLDAAEHDFEDADDGTARGFYIVRVDLMIVALETITP